MRGMGTLFAGLVVLLAATALTVYMVHEYLVAQQSLREQQMLYEKARYIAEHANITSEAVVELPEPADLIVIDPKGIPHIAENVTRLALPWPVGNVKIFVAKRGNTGVGAADPEASIASAPLENSLSNIGAELEQLNNSINSLNNSIQQLRTQLGGAKELVSDDKTYCDDTPNSNLNPTKVIRYTLELDKPSLVILTATFSVNNRNCNGETGWYNWVQGVINIYVGGELAASKSLRIDNPETSSTVRISAVVYVPAGNTRVKIAIAMDRYGWYGSARLSDIHVIALASS